MSTFVLKHFPGMRAEEDYNYVSMAQQERSLLHLERDWTERNIRNDIDSDLHIMNQDPIFKLPEHHVSDPISIDSKLQDPDPIEPRRLLDDPARESYSSAQQDFEFGDDNELPVSTIFTEGHYSNSNSNVVEGRSSTVVVATPPLRVARAMDMVPGASRVSVGCSVSAMLQGTAQAWTWFLDLLLPRILFRGRDLRDSCKPESE